MLSLTGCQIAFVRLTSLTNGVPADHLQKEIPSQGGQLVTQVDQCTHLIATEDQYRKKGVRVKEAIAKGDVLIVTFDWLEKSLDVNRKLDETEYLLHIADADNKPTPETSKGQKRSHVTSEDDGDNPITTGKKVKAKQDEVVSLNVPAKKEHENDVSVTVPVDEGLSNPTSYKVFIDKDGTVFDATLNQTNSGNNNNKFYRIQLLVRDSGKHCCWTRWGRVGEGGQSMMLGDGTQTSARAEFEKKFRNKNGNTWAKRLDPIKAGKYSFIERSYEDSDHEDDGPEIPKDKNKGVKKEEEESDEEDIRSKLEEPVQRLMKLIFNQEYFDSTLTSLDYDVNKMPLGKLSKSTLLRGYSVLKDLTAQIASTRPSGVTDLSNQYFSLIPHAFGRNRPPVLNNMTIIKKEIELLESLTDMQLASDIMKNAKGKKGAKEQTNLLDRQYEGLGMQEMTPLDPNSVEFEELQTYLTKSSGQTHSVRYKVQDIFRIERKGEDARFKSSKFASLPQSDRRLLWHGSRCTNFGGILSQGLRIAPPEAPVNGYMFGKGVYLADMSTKSAGYCSPHDSGGIGLLLLCEAELGKPPLKLTDANPTAAEDSAKQGSVSTWGVGQTAPQKWKDAGVVRDSLRGVRMPDLVDKPPGPTKIGGAYLQYNEYIVYDVAQVKMRYLFRCQIN